VEVFGGVSSKDTGEVLAVEWFTEVRKHLGAQQKDVLVDCGNPIVGDLI
jgi:hypothetical protein